MQANDYKERSYPVWNLLKELDAEGKLTPLQKVLTAPTMPPEELYDEVADPYETKNLVDSAEHREALEKLRKALGDWIETSNDQGRVLESPELATAKGVTKAGNDPATGAKKGKKQKQS